jgi:hypothetical protein
MLLPAIIVAQLISTTTAEQGVSGAASIVMDTFL